MPTSDSEKSIAQSEKTAAKFCIDCRHFSGGIQCHHSRSGLLDSKSLIRGPVLIHYYDCESMRVHGGICSTEAKLFEPRDAT